MTEPKDTTPVEGHTEPTPGLLRRVELAAIDKMKNLLGMKEKPESERIHRLTPEQEAELRRIEERAIATFHGDLNVLESALGMLRVGHHWGWRVLYIIHSKKTIRNYEQILGIQVRELFEETGPSSYRSIGLNLADRYPNFWKVVSGDIKIPRRKDVIS